MAGAKPPVVWSPQARADLVSIWRYYNEAAGIETADGIVRSVVNATRLLGEHPHIGRSRDEVRPGLRSIASRPFVIFYRVTAADAVEIIRAIDGRRDIDDVFADENRE